MSTEETKIDDAKTGYANPELMFKVDLGWTVMQFGPDCDYEEIADKTVREVFDDLKAKMLDGLQNDPNCLQRVPAPK